MPSPSSISPSGADRARWPPPLCTAGRSGAPCWCRRGRCCVASGAVWRKWRQPSGRSTGPRLSPEIGELVLRLAGDNPRWGHRRICGQLRKLDFIVFATSVRRLLAGAGPSRRCCFSATVGDDTRRTGCEHRLNMNATKRRRPPESNKAAPLNRGQCAVPAKPGPAQKLSPGRVAHE